MFYKWLVFIHIVSVILSIGPFFVLLPMIRKLRDVQGDGQSPYFDAFKFVVKLTKHAGHVLVFSGIFLIMLGPWTWKTPWVVLTIAIMALSLFFLARGLSPTIRKLQAATGDRTKLIDTLRRSVWMYIILLMLMLWFMVTKPMLW